MKIKSRSPPGVVRAMLSSISKWVLCGKDHVIEHPLYRVLDCETANLVSSVPNSRQALFQEIDELWDIIRALDLRSPTRCANRPINDVMETCFGEVAFDRHGRKMNYEEPIRLTVPNSQGFPDKMRRA